MRAAVIVEPEIPENTGFIARLAANFDFQLRLVDPEFNLEEARETASRAQEKLREARIFDSVEEALEDLDYIVGTKPGKGVSLEGFQPRENTSLMIGRESSGLTNRELELCDAVVHIETGEYESINQSHAAAILMHHFHIGSEKEGISSNQKQFLEKTIQTPLLKELVLRSNPTEGEINRLIGQLKQEDSSEDE
ncbi:MAG: RNA methyltransferase [Candidatus Nanosalina sp.]